MIGLTFLEARERCYFSFCCSYKRRGQGEWREGRTPLGISGNSPEGPAVLSSPILKEKQRLGLPTGEVTVLNFLHFSLFLIRVNGYLALV